MIHKFFATLIDFWSVITTWFIGATNFEWFKPLAVLPLFSTVWYSGQNIDIATNFFYYFSFHILCNLHQSSHSIVFQHYCHACHAIASTIFLPTQYFGLIYNDMLIENNKIRRQTMPNFHTNNIGRPMSKSNMYKTKT